MPQLDIMSWSTQIFWAITSITAVYFLLVKVVLPDILLQMKIRQRVLELLEQKVILAEKAAENKPKTLDELFIELEKTLERKASVNPETHKFHLRNKYTNSNSKAFLLALEEATYKTKLAPFLTLIAPTDEFILTLSFVFFFYIFYTYFSFDLIGRNLDLQIQELTDKFSKYSALKELNTQQVLKELNALRFRDKESLILLTKLSLAFDYAYDYAFQSSKHEKLDNKLYSVVIRYFGFKSNTNSFKPFTTLKPSSKFVLRRFLRKFKRKVALICISSGNTNPAYIKRTQGIIKKLQSMLPSKKNPFKKILQNKKPRFINQNYISLIPQKYKSLNERTKLFRQRIFKSKRTVPKPLHYTGRAFSLFKFL